MASSVRVYESFEQDEHDNQLNLHRSGGALCSREVLEHLRKLAFCAMLFVRWPTGLDEFSDCLPVADLNGGAETGCLARSLEPPLFY